MALHIKSNKIISLFCFDHELYLYDITLNKYIFLNQLRDFKQTYFLFIQVILSSFLYLHNGIKEKKIIEYK